MRSSQRRPGPALTLGVIVAAAGLVAAVSLAACAQGRSCRLIGKMHVPPGLQGTAQWGNVWLVTNYDRLRRDLAEHERVLRLALLAKDSDFLRSKEAVVLRLGVIEAELKALNNGRIPVQSIAPKSVPITPLTSLDSLIVGIEVVTRPATAAERGDTIERMRQALKDSAIVIRGQMYSAVKDLIQQRSEQKQRLLADADGIVAPQRLRSVRVQLDGEYFMDDVPVGRYGLYGQYVLSQWFVLTPVTVEGGTVQRDIPRLSNLVSESRAISSLDALCNRIDRM